MRNCVKFYVDGQWYVPEVYTCLELINPSTEEPSGSVALGTADDVDMAVIAAGRAAESYALTSRAERIALLERILDGYRSRADDLAEAMGLEMGAPITFSRQAQVGVGEAHFVSVIAALKKFQFENDNGATHSQKEPIGVVGFITPWNWPMNLIACKLAPALATGCTVVWKPSEFSPYSATVLMEILHDAGVPAGVVNMIFGDGPYVGYALSSHPQLDMISFTGSGQAGVAVAQAAFPTIKHVAQEPGGKSVNIILDDANFEHAVEAGVRNMFINSGQNCNAPSRMLVPASRQIAAEAIARRVAGDVIIGRADDPDATMGPVVNAVQWHHIQDFIGSGINDGATLVTGGTGLPDIIGAGYYVKPTVFSNVNNDMTIATDEVFGPVLCILPYDTEEHAIQIANDSPFGLSAYISSRDTQRARSVASRVHAGTIFINQTLDFGAGFGGSKQSGNGRTWGAHGFEEFLETKSFLGSAA